MALLRLIHAAEMPDPAACARDAGRWRGGSCGDGVRRAARPAPKASIPADFPSLVDAVEARESNCSGSSFATMSVWSASLPAKSC